MAILIYLLGFIVSYLLHKYYTRKILYDPWTIGERKVTLTCSLFSWIWVLVIIISIIADSPNNKSAKW